MCRVCNSVNIFSEHILSVSPYRCVRAARPPPSVTSAATPDQYSLSAPDDPIPVETWFGPGAALFRIASLHPFTHELAASGDGVTRALRFPG